MPPSDGSSKHENTYFSDADNAGEMARLMKQDQIVTREMGELFPPVVDPAKMHNVLDVACGPGGWVIEAARNYPQIQITGVDKSQMMINFARTISSAYSNAQFRSMDVTQPLDFDDASFDFVNIRFISGFMGVNAWPRLLHECMRILRPGGIVRLTESEIPVTNSVAGDRMAALLTQAFHLARQSFSPNGRHIGITPVMKRLLRNAGFEVIQHQAFAIDFSAGTDIHEDFSHNQSIAGHLMTPFLVRMGVATYEEVESLYQQSVQEMRSESLCGIWFLLSVSARKPGATGAAE